MGSTAIKNWGFFGVCVALLEKVSHCADGLWRLHPAWSETLLLTAYREEFSPGCLWITVELLALLAPRLPGCCDPFCHDDNGLNL